MASSAPASETNLALGIDVGGTGVKTALVNVATGELVSRRIRSKTPHPATPDAVAERIREVVDEVASEHALPDTLPAGCGLPGVIKGGRVMTAANIDKAWVDLSAEELIGEALGRRVHAVNDADAAAMAEVRIGAGRECNGTVLLLTVGTGIGSGLVVGGQLVPNTEFGHIEVKGRDAETRLSGAARERRKLRWSAWAEEFNVYLAQIEAYLWPDLIILGGGVSKTLDKFGHRLRSRAPIVPAQFLNIAGIIGAAMAAADGKAFRPDTASQPDTASPSDTAPTPDTASPPDTAPTPDTVSPSETEPAS